MNDMKDILQNTLYLVCVGVIPLLVRYITVYLQVKVKEQTAKMESEQMKAYIDAAMNAITTAVNETNQTYVDTLKAQGRFDKDAQAVAFQKSIETANRLISDDMKLAITTLYSDYDTFMNAQISAMVRENKITV